MPKTNYKLTAAQLTEICTSRSWGKHNGLNAYHAYPTPGKILAKDYAKEPGNNLKVIATVSQELMRGKELANVCFQRAS